MAGIGGKTLCALVMDMFRWIVEIVLRHAPEEGFRHLTKALGCRAYFWLAQLVSALESTDYERLPQTSETFIYIAMIRIMIRRLA